MASGIKNTWKAISLTKINSKWTSDLNVKTKSMKLLDDDIEEKSGWLRSWHFYTLVKVQSMKKETDKMDFTDLKNSAIHNII